MANPNDRDYSRKGQKICVAFGGECYGWGVIRYETAATIAVTLDADPWGIAEFPRAHYSTVNAARHFLFVKRIYVIEPAKIIYYILFLKIKRGFPLFSFNKCHIPSFPQKTNLRYHGIQVLHKNIL